MASGGGWDVEGKEAVTVEQCGRCHGICLSPRLLLRSATAAVRAVNATLRVSSVEFRPAAERPYSARSEASGRPTGRSVLMRVKAAVHTAPLPHSASTQTSARSRADW